MGDSSMHCLLVMVFLPLLANAYCEDKSVTEANVRKGTSSYNYCGGQNGSRPLCTTFRLWSTSGDRYQVNTNVGSWVDGAGDCGDKWYEGSSWGPYQDSSPHTDEYYPGSVTITASDKSKFKQTCMTFEIQCITPANGDACNFYVEDRK